LNGHKQFVNIYESVYMGGTGGAENVFWYQTLNHNFNLTITKNYQFSVVFIYLW